MSIPDPSLADGDGTRSVRRRALTWPRLIGLLVVVALLPSFIDVFVLDGRSDSLFPDQEAVNDRAISSAVTMLIVVAAVSMLRWWPDVLHEQLRARAWVWAVPVLFLGTSLALTDYTRIATAGVSITLVLLVAVLCIAIGEELLFRGVTLVFLRGRSREWVAAAVSCVIFGLMHFPAGPVQVVASALFGWLLYLCRRVSGGIVVPIAVHAAWDFSVFTSFLTASPETSSNASIALSLLTIVFVAITTIGWKLWQPQGDEPATRAVAGP